MKDVIKINLSSVEYLIVSLCVSGYYKTSHRGLGRSVCQFFECPYVVAIPTGSGGSGGAISSARSSVNSLSNIPNSVDHNKSFYLFYRNLSVKGTTQCQQQLSEPQDFRSWQQLPVTQPSAEAPTWTDRRFEEGFCHCHQQHPFRHLQHLETRPELREQ